MTAQKNSYNAADGRGAGVNVQQNSIDAEFGIAPAV